MKTFCFKKFKENYKRIKITSASFDVIVLLLVSTARDCSTFNPHSSFLVQYPRMHILLTKHMIIKNIHDIQLLTKSKLTSQWWKNCQDFMNSGKFPTPTRKKYKAWPSKRELVCTLYHNNWTTFSGHLIEPHSQGTCCCTAADFFLIVQNAEK